MKSRIQICLLFSVVFMLITSMKPDLKDRIIGRYHLEKATANGQPIPANQMDRTVTFFENNQFSSDINFPGGQNYPFNQGFYMVQNDSTLVLHHTEKGKFLDVAWVYNYKFIGDTLCYKGFYTMAVPQNPNVLVKFNVDEKWVRISKPNNINQSAQTDDPAILYKKRIYSLSNDSVKVVLKVIQYSKAIIDYEISIKTAKGKIEQKGYALNLSSELNGGVEVESYEVGNEVWVVAYNTYYCNLENQKDLEIRISTDQQKVGIVTSERLRNELFKNKLKEGGKSEYKVQLCGYLHLEK